MSKYGFEIFWSDEDQGYIVTCPDFPGLSAFGETEEDALAEGKVALELFIESLESEGSALPQETQVAQYSGQLRLRMPSSLHRSLVQRAKADGVSLNTFLVYLLTERKHLDAQAEMMAFGHDWDKVQVTDSYELK